MASVLNDPECFPETSALAYGRADPVRFDPAAFQRERTHIRDLLDACLPKLSHPGLLSTTVEEVTWMTEWLTGTGSRFTSKNNSTRPPSSATPFALSALSRRRLALRLRSGQAGPAHRPALQDHPHLHPPPIKGEGGVRGVRVNFVSRRAWMLVGRRKPDALASLV